MLPDDHINPLSNQCRHLDGEIKLEPRGLMVPFILKAEGKLLLSQEMWSGLKHT